MNSNISLFLVRFGVAFAFIYVAFSMRINPDSWIGYYPDFVLNNIPVNLLLWASTIGHTVIGLWILLSRRICIPASLASLALIGIIASNLGSMDVIFRDVTILCASLALAIEGWHHEVWGIGHRSWTHHPELN